MFGKALVACSAVLAITTQVSAIATISAVGSKFFTSDGDQWYVKGVAYQLTEKDPLVDTTQCKLDASLMEDLGANAIRVYHVDADSDHDGCMTAFADAGVYLFLDLDTFNTAISGTDPHWNETQLSAFEAVLDTFSGYDNLAGVFVGNEVLTTPADSGAAPYVLAAARDVKAYRDKKNYRDIPVGYSAADIASLRPMLQNYFECRDNASERLDFFSLNAYEWCGDSSYTVSGYSTLQSQAEGYPVPIFFSETGCNTVQPRTFDDQAAILGSDMDGTWSGAIIYEWIEEVNNYGLVSYGPEVAATATGSNIQDGFTRSGTPTPVSPDFSNLKSQWATLTPTGTPLSAYTDSSSTLPACPATTASGWTVDASASLPTLGQTGSNTASATSGAATSGSSASGTASGASASTSSAAALKVANPVSAIMGEGGIISATVAALMLLGAGFVWWL
ncbi:putative ph-responsive protein [Phaeomoniella chlamydospora]|uniref:1,3-beta-glucanosyltransferase n=1 Tax=Phaeomoniella chlamydospora TaxID=158046 RepID=A0A0G2E3U1_PHACM|nr:putative ph-responsive protein [Phaeomoniella chlamydospora]